jgi:NAD(P)-dependent dehydrogenase (short-subunit alcohol dehydrogenase family)
VTTSDGAPQGRVCWVTGATSGIGKATALRLAALGAGVLVVGRMEAKTRDVVAQIRHMTGNSSVCSPALTRMPRAAITFI